MTGNRKFFLSLALLVGVGGCGGGPTEPPKPPPPPPVAVDVTVTVVLPYPKEGGPGAEGASITCLQGCGEQVVGITDNRGQVTFEAVRSFLTVKVEGDEYVPLEEVNQIYTGDTVVISHVWPEEAEESFQRLIIGQEIILHWGEEVVLASVGINGVFFYPVVAVRNYPGNRRFMFHVLVHELYHAHQWFHANIGDGNHWKHSPEGEAYAVALEADRAAERLFPPIDAQPSLQSLKENAADFFAWWLGKGKDDTDRANLCEIAIARCQVMEDFYGPRPPGYS